MSHIGARFLRTTHIPFIIKTTDIVGSVDKMAGMTFGIHCDRSLPNSAQQIWLKNKNYNYIQY